MPTIAEKTEATPSSHRAVDFTAVSRVARMVDLREIRLADIAAAGRPARGLLVPSWKHECKVSGLSKDELEVTCEYRFNVTSEGSEVAAISLRYVLSYTLQSEAGPDPKDADDFAFANGTYHSWPFVRQTLFDLTARMGFPPFTLPVFLFNPKTNAKKAPADTTPAAPQPAKAASKHGAAKSDS